MKYISLLVFFVALQWSWSVTHKEAAIREEVHVGIQDDLKRIISEYIQENLPSATNLTFSKFWTEKLADTKIKAYFVYSFTDANSVNAPARVEIEGYSILNRSKDDGDLEVWSFDELYILNNDINFKNALEILANDTDDEDLDPEIEPTSASESLEE